MLERFEVHSHTHYSNIRLLDCINKPEDLVKKAFDIGLKGIAVTDHECIAGHVQLNKLKKEYPDDFKIGLGDEVYLIDERYPDQKYYHFILIAKDLIGHTQLRQISSKAWMNSYMDRGLERVPILKSEVEKIIGIHTGHLIATTACIGGELGNWILAMEKARKTKDKDGELIAYNHIIKFYEWGKKVFGDDFYFEIAPGLSKEQQIVNKKIVQIGKVADIKVVIGTDAHYLTPEDRYVHESYLNSKGGEREVASFYEFAYLQTEDKIISNLHQEKEGEFSSEEIKTFFDNSMEIYNKIENFSLLHAQEIPSIEVIDYPKKDRVIENCPIISQMYQSDDIYDRYWINQCDEALHQKGKDEPKYWERLEYEADINKTIGEKLGTNIFRYPIVLQHYIDMMWECGSLVGAGRGSSCSGLNHWLLGVTQLDPLVWDFPYWRFLNKDRIELPDIDLDLAPSKRPMILQRIKSERGKKFAADIDEQSRQNLGCSLVATFGTETSKSAILTACRGYRSEDYSDGIDSDTGQYLSSLVPIERGFLWSIDEMINGNPEKDRKPVTTFINEVKKYPGLLDIIVGIEGLINKRSSHASGVILFDEDPYRYCGFMRTPKGEIITSYDLHDVEAAGATKYDFLVTEVEDKLGQCIEFLQEFGEIEKDLSLREIYNKYLHPDVLPFEDAATWQNIQNGKILNVFQFDSEVGSQSIKKIKPKNITELTDCNGLMRLMPDKNTETPMEKYARFRTDINLWYEEMSKAGLSPQEQKALEPYYLQSYGVPPSQEQMMRYLMDENICGFTLAEANAARKVVAKKQMNKIPDLKKQVMEKAKSEALGKYIWNCGVAYQLGYAFSVIHSGAYSIIGYQTAYIATKWDPIYWDTACLVVNAGSLEEEEDVEYDEDGNVGEKKDKSADYAKMAKAIGEILEHGISISLVDINASDFGFEPDKENHMIRYGLKALTNVGSEIIDKIKEGRPYTSIKDFMERCPIKKPAMVALIKGGAFDELCKDWGEATGIHPRILAMGYFIAAASEPKKKLNLTNFNGLLEQGLIPQELDFERRVFIFNKWINANCKKLGYFWFGEEACRKFYNEFFDVDLLELADNGVPVIKCEKWKKQYDKVMDKARNWIKEHHDETLASYNQILFNKTWEKYGKGNISAWEMEALCFYYNEHELAHVNNKRYGIEDFSLMPTTPRVAKFFKRNGREIPLYEIHRIAGTVIAKNNTRHSIELLTTTGVVTVKFTKDFYAMFGRQISEVNAQGEKKIVEKGWFVRGTKLLLAGYRRDDTFVSKKYKDTPGHQIYKITKVDGETIELEHNRYGQSDE